MCTPLIAFYEGARPGDTTYKVLPVCSPVCRFTEARFPALAYDWMWRGPLRSIRRLCLCFFERPVQQSWDTIAAVLRKRAVAPEVYERS